MLCLTLMSLIIGVVSNLGKADECKTPNNEAAQCISLYSCPVLLNAPSDPTKREFVRQSNCGGTAVEPMVCCGSQSNFTAPKQNQKHSHLQDLLPDRRICGRQHSDDYFSTVNGTTVTTFPWMALISFAITHSRVTLGFHCSGSLINRKYVLTAGHCVNIRLIKPVNVRLGEYHTGNKTDCVKDGQIIECIDSILDFGIEKVILHPELGEVDANRISVWKHDIALIRLNGSVDYTDYIRSICLPLSGSKRPKIGDLLAASGWGTVILDIGPVIKKRKYSNLITNHECEEMFRKRNVTLSLQEYHICGSPSDNNEATCPQDGGSPVMFSHKLQWQQEGIVSSGICNTGFPGIYTNVEYYLDWIEENIEP